MIMAFQKIADVPGKRSLTVAALIEVVALIGAATVRERWLRIAHHLRGHS